MKVDPVDLKRLSDVLDKQVVKNKNISTLNTKVNSLEKKIPDLNTLFQINQYNKDKQSLQKKIVIFIKKIPDVSGLSITTVLTTVLNYWSWEQNS